MKQVIMSARAPKLCGGQGGKASSLIVTNGSSIIEP
jgi:hypothetical protein